MAQYGHNWYGTAYYGGTNAFSGWYETKPVFTDEPLNGTVTLNIRASLPSASYGPTAAEVYKAAGTWTHDSALGKISSSTATAELRLTATGDNFVIRYEQRTIAAKMTISVKTTQPGLAPVVTTHTLNTQGASVNANMAFTIPGLKFAKHEVTIKMATDSPVGAAFNFKGFSVRTANITLESQAWLNAAADGTYATLVPTITPIAGSTDVMVTAVTPSYATKNYLQLKLYLASSDNGTTPEVFYIEMVSGNSKNRTANGEWSAVFNMQQIAIQAGTSFQKVEEVVWAESVPSTTNLTIRSQSSIDNLNMWDPVTVPYKQGIHRIRLKEGRMSGFVDAPTNAPASKRPFVVTKEWDSWNDQSFLPPVNSGVNVTYDFLNTQRDNNLNPYHRITNPMRVADRVLRGTDLRNLDNVLRITLTRVAGRQTPVVDFIHLSSFMRYEQDVSTENQEFSAVDFANKGKGIVLDMNAASFRQKFKIPVEVTAPQYELIDETNRPQDVAIYLDSQKTEAIRSGKTASLSDKVWAEAKVQASNSKTGLIKNYQYGGGQVKFPLTDEIQLAPTFTPSLKGEARYRYHLQLGWPQEYHVVQQGEKLADIAPLYGQTPESMKVTNPGMAYNNDGGLMAGQQLLIPNDSVNNDVRIYWKSTMNERTSKSSHNAVLLGSVNVESDSIVAEVKQASTYGWVDWVSEEKIYDGVVNLNDIPNEYRRKHTTPESGDSAQVEYEAIVGDTYKKIANIFGVHEDDVRRLNGSDAGEPAAGKKVLVPSRIVLPRLIPEAVVTDNPYHVEIVYNSVKKKDGQVLTTSAMDVRPLTIIYKQVEREATLTRGKIANGRDVLPDPRVKSILSVKSADGMIAYNPYDTNLKIGEYQKNGNYVDWAVSGREPAPDAKYTVRYMTEVPESVTVTIDTNYMEEGGVDRIWRSPEVKEFKGVCYPGHDYVAELPPMLTWKGLPDASVEDLQYIVEDNDIWVKTWIEQRGTKWFIVGSLQDRVPKDNWFPTIKTGYYYLGKDEYYLFNEPITIEPTDREMPIAKNVEFVPGKFQSAAKIQEGSTNLILNSGFDVATEKKTVFKLTF